jgi:hypothetical protein
MCTSKVLYLKKCVHIVSSHIRKSRNSRKTEKANKIYRRLTRLDNGLNITHKHISQEEHGQPLLYYCAVQVLLINRIAAYGIVAIYFLCYSSLVSHQCYYRE